VGGGSFENIARALTQNGVPIAANAVQRWLRDRDVD
jgi:hypothetical protein